MAANINPLHHAKIRHKGAVRLGEYSILAKIYGSRKSMRKLKKYAALLCLIAAPAFAYGPYDAELISVIDGDTVKLCVAVWPGLVKTINVRLAGIDTPESRRGKKSGVAIPECEIHFGKMAGRFTEDFLTGKALQLYNVSLGKYAGRVLGTITADGEDLGSALIASGLGVEYNGGKRAIWPCQKGEY